VRGRLRFSHDLLLAHQGLRPHLRALGIASLACLGQLGLDARQAACAVGFQTLSLGVRALDPTHALVAHAQVRLPQPPGQNEKPAARTAPA